MRNENTALSENPWISGRQRPKHGWPRTTRRTPVALARNEIHLYFKVLPAIDFRILKGIRMNAGVMPSSLMNFDGK
jgi:hypothetical protein